MRPTAFTLFLFVCLVAAAPSFAHAGCKSAPQAKTQQECGTNESFGNCACSGHLCHFLRYETAAAPGTENACNHSEEEEDCSYCGCHHKGSKPAGYVPVKNWDEEERLLSCAGEPIEIFRDIMPVKAAAPEKPGKICAREDNPIFSIKWYATVLSMGGGDDDGDAAHLLPASSERPYREIA